MNENAMVGGDRSGRVWRKDPIRKEEKLTYTHTHTCTYIRDREEKIEGFALSSKSEDDAPSRYKRSKTGYRNYCLNPINYHSRLCSFRGRRRTMLVGVNRIEGRLENPKCNHPYRSSMTVQLTRIASHKGCRSQVARLTALGQSVLLLGCVLADFRGLPRVSVKRARSSSTALSIPTKLETPLRTLRLALSMRLLEPLARSGWMVEGVESKSTRILVPVVVSIGAHWVAFEKLS
ncbi:hypothetical protein V1477_003975 [Vespula maculifrons]|uniref:Uncharacterized protein n=1 Tax=Vespula maculifrons TaxID=7453 RepID=A0ABD2CSI6_VESMC